MKSVSAALAALAIGTQSASWNYEERGNNVSHWDKYFAECGYSRQSPIDLPMSSSLSCKEPLELDWVAESAHYAILNSGHSLKAVPFLIDHNGGSDISGLEVLHHTNDTKIKLKNKFYGHFDSKVNAEYCFDSMHFHWGRTSEEGSEHTINGKAYPLELHLVHYSCDYKVIGEALKDYASGTAAARHDDDNVLAVIGIMFEIGEPNPILGKMLDDMVIDGIFENKASEMPNYLELYYTEFDIKQLLPESREMMTYLGSLTTPPCYETVRWHVMKQSMTVSEEQMEQFRRLLEGTDLNEKQAPNFRPPQPRNGRTVWQCQEDVDEDNVRQISTESIAAVTDQDGAQSGNDAEWQVVAIAFGVLFGLTLLVCLGILFFVYRSQQRIKALENRPPLPPVNSYEDDEIAEMEETNA